MVAGGVDPGSEMGLGASQNGIIIAPQKKTIFQGEIMLEWMMWIDLGDSHVWKPMETAMCCFVNPSKY